MVQTGDNTTQLIEDFPSITFKALANTSQSIHKIPGGIRKSPDDEGLKSHRYRDH
jgi:hypothetical protein